MKKYHLIAGVALALTATPAAANGFYMFGEVGFAEVEADIEDGVDTVDGDGYRAGIGTGFSLVVPLTGVYLGAEISAALSYIDNDSDIEYTVADAAAAGLPPRTTKLTARYNTEEKWRAAASADAGVRLLPGFFIFARLSYAETGGEIDRIAIDALDDTDTPIELNDTQMTAASEELANREPDEDDLSGEEIGVGLLYNVPFTPISMRGIVTVDPELAFSAALVWRF